MIIRARRGRGCVARGRHRVGGSARAAEYPERSVDLVIPYAAGGGIDLLLRAMAEGFSAHFKQSFVVSNRTGPAARSALPMSRARRRTATRCCSSRRWPIRCCR